MLDHVHAIAAAEDRIASILRRRTLSPPQNRTTFSPFAVLTLCSSKEAVVVRNLLYSLPKPGIATP